MKEEFLKGLPSGYKIQNYIIKKILGKGGYSITYLAEDMNTQEKIALKEFNPFKEVLRREDERIRPNPEELEEFNLRKRKFLDEADFLINIQHENIVNVTGSFEANNTHYIVMDFLPGESLARVLKRRRLTEFELLRISLSLANALQFLHSMNVYHLDVKSLNVYIPEEGEPFLFDFGSSWQQLQLRKLPEHEEFIHTAGYAPFEVQKGFTRELGPWSDIYGLGAIMYEVIVGSKPVKASIRKETINDGKQDQVEEYLNKTEHPYSEEIKNSVKKALHLEINQRPDDAHLWVEEFQLQQLHEKARNEDKAQGGDYLREADSFWKKGKFGKAFTILKNASLRESSIAWYMMGFLNEGGKGVKQDFQRARKWYKKAALKGERRAKRDLGMLLRNKFNDDVHLLGAAQWLQRAADEGDAQAMSVLGLMYRNEVGVKKNYKKALELFRK
ncbi:MAG: protein kinase, partial [Nitrospinae bacterium]|nr:protein kinase [Nitrospinota bacterium]